MATNDTTASDAVTRYTRGLVLRGRGRFAEAADVLQGLIEREDTLGLMARYHYALAQRSLSGQALAAKDFPAAQRHLQAAMSAVGAKTALGGLLAGLYGRGGRRIECLREMEAATTASAEGDSAAFQRRLAQAQWQAGQREEAYFTLARALRRFGDNGGLHLQWGLFLAAEEKYAEARQRFEQAARIECDDADAHRYLATAAAACGDAPAATRSFQRALDLHPDDLMLAYQLSLAAKAAADAGEPVAVRLPSASAAAAPGDLRALARRIASEPDLVEALCLLPTCEADNELLTMLAGAVELAIETRPREADLHLAACRVYRRLAQREAAELRAEAALEIDPSCIRAKLHLAELATEAGLHGRAAEHYQRAILDGADWPDIHLRCGEALVRDGRADEASIHLRRALELKAGCGPAGQAVEALAA